MMGAAMVIGLIAADARAGPVRSRPGARLVWLSSRVPQVDEEAPNFLLKDSEGFQRHVGSVSRKGRSVEFLGHLVRSLQNRDAGDGAAVSVVQSHGV